MKGSENIHSKKKKVRNQIDNYLKVDAVKDFIIKVKETLP